MFYDFDDEADLSLIAHNKGQAGSEYDMHFGVILGSKNTFALTTAESVELPLKPPYWAPSTRPSDLPRGKPLVVTIVPPETLEITLPAYDPDGDALTVTITTLPANATITDLDDHTLNAGDNIPSIDGIFKVKYTVKQDIEENFQHDTFEYEAEDGSGNSASAKVFVLLNTVPQALDSSLFTVEDRSQLIRLPGTDTDGDQIRTWITHAPTRGSLYDAVSTGGDSVKIGNKIDLSTLPALVKNIGGGVYYVPPQDESGLRNFDRFAFATKDPRGQMSSDAWVEVSVKPINKLPIAYERAADTIENKAVLIDVFGVDIEGLSVPSIPSILFFVFYYLYYI